MRHTPERFMANASSSSYLTLIYVSTLADEQTPAVVANIAKRSRTNNLAWGITGLLIFDGTSFAQLLQGRVENVMVLQERLRADTRHEAIEELVLEITEPPFRFPRWELGYLLVDEEKHGIHRMRGLRGKPARRALEEMLPAVDLGIARTIPALHSWRPPYAGVRPI